MTETRDDVCSGCNQKVGPTPELVLTRRADPPEVFPFHSEACLILYVIQEMEVAVCPMNHPHCDLTR